MAKKNEQLERLQTSYTELCERLAPLLAADLPTERAAADAANAEISTILDERNAVKARIDAIEAEESRRDADARAQEQLGQTDLDPAGQPRAVILSEPLTYQRTGSHSYHLDLARHTLQRGDGDGGVDAATARLRRHAAELQVELPAREARRDKLARELADQEFRRAGYGAEVRESAFEKRVNPNRTDGQGGFFVPPLWLIDQFIDLPRFGRTTANLCKNMPLPTGTDSINLPKIATGTAVGVQTGDAGATTMQDLTDTSVSAAVRTLEGHQDIALQLLDQSPIAFDEVVGEDLQADYNAKVDTQVVNGSGVAGQLLGILNVPGINAITYTDATPTLPEMWPALLQSASLIFKLRKLAATGVVVTPSMWYWALSQLDTTNRPLIVPNPNAMNSMGDNGLLDTDGPAGMFTYGLPSYLDGNVPSNLGAGTNESRAITARWQDLFLWEGSMKTRVLQEVLSATLQVRIQVYNYVAFMPHRRPEAISAISGTGMISPTGF